MNWIDAKNDSIKPYIDMVVLCYCPEWCDCEYQVAQWNGNEFYYEDQPNDMFNRNVEAWCFFTKVDAI